MSGIPGVRPPELQSLLRVQDRLTFLYAEHCVVNRADNAVTITDARGTVHVPAATLSVLMLGPGSNITYAAICLLAESRSTCIWVGEHGVRYYCHGASLAQLAQQVDDVSVAARRGIRDRMKDGKFMQRCVKDIRSLLLTPDEAESDSPEVEDITTQLWAGASGYRASGKNYSVESDMFINDDEDLHVDFDVEDGEF